MGLDGDVARPVARDRDAGGPALVDPPARVSARRIGLGIAAYAIRYGTLAFDPPLWLATAGIPLHGVGVACFSVGGQMFVDSRAPGDRRASASRSTPWSPAGWARCSGASWPARWWRLFPGRFGPVFLVPCVINVGLILLLFLKFRPEPRRPAPGLGSPTV